MREIKFRGRGAPRGKQWFYGDLDTHTSGVCILDNDTLHTVISETVGQYTGLKDSNGREIYEGDIVECESGRICQVVFFTSECACCFDLSPVGGFDCEPPKGSTLWKDLIVIGNIHDNPELLK